MEGPSLVTTEPEGEYSPNTLIIMYDEAVGKEPLLEAIETYGAEVKYDYSLIPGMKPRNFQPVTGYARKCLLQR